MAKRKKKKSNGAPKGGVALKSKVAQASAEEHDGDRVDYGGLPRRDLKKNLGCG